MPDQNRAQLPECSAVGFEDMNFIISNLKDLKIKGCLEKSLIPAYLHAGNFKNMPFQTIKKLFDSCEKEILQQQYELPIRDPLPEFEPIYRFSRMCWK